MHIDALFRTSFFFTMTDPHTTEEQPKKPNPQPKTVPNKPNPQTTRRAEPAITQPTVTQPTVTQPTAREHKPAQVWQSFIMQFRRSLIKAFWSGVQIKETGDCNKDYGEHFCTLNFPPSAVMKKRRTEVTKNTTAQDRMKAWDSSLDIIAENGQPTLHDGSRTYGLVLDKQNNPDKALDTPKDLTPEQEKVLNELRTELIKARQECNESNTQFLRINLVKGACTIWHTDNFKNSLLPNYFCILPPMKEAEDWQPDELQFTLRVRLWPCFKTSFVLFRNEICIPFSFGDCPAGEDFRHDKEVRSGGYIQMIKVCKDTGRAKWMIVNPKLLVELKPHLCINPKLAVAGIRDGKIVLCKKNYGSRAVTSWVNDGSGLVAMDFQELLADEKNKRDHTANLYRIQNYDTTYRLFMFRGWQNIHSVCPSSNFSAVRLHIFFRNMRTVNVCANASIKVAKEGSIDIISE